MGKTASSPETAKSGRTWCFWKLLLKCKLCEQNSFAELLTLSVELGTSDFTAIFFEVIKKQVTSSELECRLTNIQLSHTGRHI